MTLDDGKDLDAVTNLCERECDCMGDCLGEDDGASWSEPAQDWVVTEYGFEDRGLL